MAVSKAPSTQFSHFVLVVVVKFRRHLHKLPRTSFNVYLFRWGITSWMVVECRNVGKSAAMDYLWESTINALITMGPQLRDPPHKVTPLRQVAKDRLVSVVLALSKDHHVKRGQDW
jgi:hypothetical protein